MSLAMPNTAQMEKYARLLIKNGLNLQKGQNLIINAAVEAAPFVRLVVKEAYRESASQVLLNYRDEAADLIRYQEAPMETFHDQKTFQWKADGLAQMAAQGAAVLSLVGGDPDIFKEADPEKIAAANKTNSVQMKEFRRYTMNSDISWCVAAVPSEAWARKVFPGEEEAQALALLWKNVLQATRADLEDPVAAWQTHTKTLEEKMKWLNEQQFESLHYQAAGTDLTVRLPKGHLWAGGGEENGQGTYFIANMPTEEVFTAPQRDGAEGYVSSTKPLNYAGSLIDEFTLTFEKGRIIKAVAKQGQETLQKLIQTDEGARYLGEVALVPHRSPVSDTGIIFYNTLFDENASCHFAIGNAYPSCLQGGQKMDEQALQAHGLNTSLTHVDFMVGGPDLCITAKTAKGESVQVFKDGNWAF